MVRKGQASQAGIVLFGTMSSLLRRLRNVPQGRGIPAVQIKAVQAGGTFENPPADSSHANCT